MKQILSDPRLNLHPGEWYLGDEYRHIYTVLGSCVSLTAWHPRLQVGGLCHFVLPGESNNKNKAENNNENSTARYAKNALLIMKKAMLTYAPIGEFQVGLFGGSNTLNHYNVGKQNVHFAKQWLHDEKIVLHKMDVGGKISRSLTLNISSGLIIVKNYVMHTN